MQGATLPLTTVFMTDLTGLNRIC